MKKYLAFIIFFTAFASCKTPETNEGQTGEQPMARVFEKKLFLSDFLSNIPKQLNKKDSLLFVNSYVEQWILNELIRHQAENNLLPEQKNIEKEIDEYRKNLLVYRYETELVKQKLDTSVSQRETEEYYNAHTQNFMLKDNIVKVTYVKIALKSPNIEKVKKWYLSADAKDRDNLKKYCIQYADNFFLDDNTWLLLEDVMREIPLHDYNPELLLKTTRKIEISDSLFNYFLFIKEFKIKNMPSPLSFERDNIRQVIINKRKLQLIEEMKQSVYSQAKESRNFEIYK
ncbi:MAG TPA: hypothetical protein VNZ49_14065 [Bacteroidia bacterium]|jgi:hypothetical protein|nr:hypothetical protein [Bacteroidia bacterium]